MKILILCARLNENRWLPAVSALNKKAKVKFLTSKKLSNQYDFCEHLPVLLSSSKTKHNALEMPNPYKLKKIISSFNPDLIHVFGEPNYPHTSLVLRFFKGHVTCRMAQNIFQKWPFPFSLMERSAFKKLSHIFPVSIMSKDLLIEKGFEGSSSIVGNGFDPKIFTSNNAADPKSGLLYVGKLIKRKGVDTLIDAVNILHKDNINIELTIIGNGPEKKLIIKKIQDYGLEKKIKIINKLPHNKLVKQYKAAKYVIVPSKRSLGGDWSFGKYIKFARVKWEEQFCMVAVESMACNTPVLASDSGALPEVVGNQENIFKSGDPKDLANLIKNKIKQSDIDYQEECLSVSELSSNYSWEEISSCFLKEWVKKIEQK